MHAHPKTENYGSMILTHLDETVCEIYKFAQTLGAVNRQPTATTISSCLCTDNSEEKNRQLRPELSYAFYTKQTVHAASLWSDLLVHWFSGRDWS